MAEGIGLLNQRTILLYHGFESLFLRADKKRRLLFFVYCLSIQAKKQVLKGNLKKKTPFFDGCFVI